MKAASMERRMVVLLVVKKSGKKAGHSEEILVDYLDIPKGHPLVALMALSWVVMTGLH